MPTRTLGLVQAIAGRTTQVYINESPMVNTSALLLVEAFTSARRTPLTALGLRPGLLCPVAPKSTTQARITYGYVKLYHKNPSLANTRKPQAPDVHYNKGLYYMYYSVSTLGSQDSVIGVATSRDMEAGSWKDHGSTDLSSTSASPWNAIDANWIEINGDQYINFGSYWHNLFQAGEQNGLKVRVDEAHNIAYNSTGPATEHRMEASFMVEHDGWYYLFFSVGKADQYDTRPPAPGEEYHIEVCRSSSGTADFVSFLRFQSYIGCGRQ